MSFDYAALAADAAGLISEFGAPATLKSITPGTYDPATGTSTPVETSTSVDAVVFPYTDRQIDGTMILAGDEQAYIGAVGITAPKPADTITWRSRVYRIVKVKDLSPAGTSVLFECQIRR